MADYNPMLATQCWLAWSGAVWEQQCKMSKIMLDATQKNVRAAWGLKTPANGQGAAAAANGGGAQPQRVVTISEAGECTATRPRSTAPTRRTPPRRTHAMPV